MAETPEKEGNGPPKEYTKQEKAAQKAALKNQLKQSRDEIKDAERRVKLLNVLSESDREDFESAAQKIIETDPRHNSDSKLRKARLESPEADLTALERNKRQAKTIQDYRLTGYTFNGSSVDSLEKKANKYKESYINYQNEKFGLIESQERLKAAKNGTKFDDTVLTVPKLLQRNNISEMKDRVDSMVQDAKLGYKGIGDRIFAPRVMTDEAQEAFEKAHKAKKEYKEAKSAHKELSKGAGSEELISKQDMLTKKQALNQARAERGKYGETAGDVRRYFKEFVMKEINSVRDDANSYFDKFKSRANSGKGSAEDPSKDSGRGGR